MVPSAARPAPAHHLGAFPVHRESADRSALRHAEEVLRQGQVLVLFPEGTRQEGPSASTICRRGRPSWRRAPGPCSCPVGIGNSDLAMPKGHLIPKPLKIRVVVGQPMAAPERSEGGTGGPQPRCTPPPPSSGERIQHVYDQARR